MPVVSQQIQQYNGDYALSDTLRGQAIFDFYTLGGDTIKNGEFRFQKFTEQYKDSDTIHGFVLNGLFNNNVKEGLWRYVSRNFTIFGNPQALDARVVYDVSGKEFLIHGHFDQGVAHGKYEILNRNLVESQPADTSFYVQFEYQNGQANGFLHGFSDNLVVEGSFDDNGFLDGDWVFTHVQGLTTAIKEIRRYDHGFFSKHFYLIEDELYEIKHIGFDTEAHRKSGLLASIPITSTYFRALDYTDIVIDTSAIHQYFKKDSFQQLLTNTNHFMERALINPSFHNDINVWTKVAGSKPIRPIQIKIIKHEYTDQDSVLNFASEKYITETLSMIRNFLNNPIIQINRFSQQHLSLYYNVLKIYENRLLQLKPIVDFLVDEASKYVDHHELLTHYSSDISYPASIAYDFEDTQKVGSYDFPSAPSHYTISQINTHLKDVFEDVSQLIDKSTHSIQVFKAQSDLLDKEQILIQLKDSLENLYTNNDSSEPQRGIHKQVEDHILSTLDTSFKKYSLKSPPQRLLEIDTMLDCYKQYIYLYEQLHDIDNRIREIDQEYTRSVWNAYTYTYMEERVKERLFTVYKETLLPYFIRQLKEHQFCTDTHRAIRNIDSLLLLMLQLRMEDTRALERQLRRTEKTVQAYLTILGLELQQ